MYKISVLYNGGKAKLFQKCLFVQTLLYPFTCKAMCFILEEPNGLHIRGREGRSVENGVPGHEDVRSAAFGCINKQCGAACCGYGRNPSLFLWSLPSSDAPWSVRAHSFLSV